MIKLNKECREVLDQALQAEKLTHEDIPIEIYPLIKNLLYKINARSCSEYILERKISKLSSLYDAESSRVRDLIDERDAKMGYWR